MRLVIITPAQPGSLYGNRRTALRWARHLRGMGHTVKVAVTWDGKRADGMIALHARRSHAALSAWKNAYPERPLILVLTGTDVYRDIRGDPLARQSLLLADRLVVLQPQALTELSPDCRSKAQVIFQSVGRRRRQKPPGSHFLVSVIGHLRDEKDPWRAALALAKLPSADRLRIVQIGAAMSREAAAQAGSLMEAERRYRWLGQLDHASTMRWLARSHLMIISSLMEGGAHVVSEAIGLGVPVLASQIPGNVGLLGEGYPGYFKPADEQDLAQMLRRALDEPAYLASLAAAVRARQPLVDPASERQALTAMIQAIQTR